MLRGLDHIVRAQPSSLPAGDGARLAALRLWVRDLTAAAGALGDAGVEFSRAPRRIVVGRNTAQGATLVLMQA